MAMGHFPSIFKKLGFYLQFYSHVFSLHQPNLQGVLNICQIQVAEGDGAGFCTRNIFLMDSAKT